MISKDVLGYLVPDIQVLRKFPDSGQKDVFLVNHKELGQVIFKLVKADDKRVEREIQIVTENAFTNVPKILKVISLQDSGNEYMGVFEQYIDGVTLTEKLSKKSLNIKEGLALLITLLDLVCSLEKVGVVHRDIKPDNIICSKDGGYYLIDFGIARHLNQISLTFTQAQVGPHTPGYGAPELFQYRKREIDSRADLFSIGVVLYESLTGVHPFVTGTEIDYNEVWYKTNTTIPRDIVIEGDKDKQLLLFIQTLMQKHITRRPPSAKKACEWLEAVIDTLGQEGT